MSQIKGIGASSGVNTAKAFLLKKPELNISNNKTKNPTDEVALVKKSVDKTINDLHRIKAIALEKLGEEKAFIFDAHIQIASDPEILNEVYELINKDSKNAANATKETFDKFYKMFSEMEDAYFKERASDIKDVCDRLLSNILNVELPNILDINNEVIIVADDLGPSETAMLDKKYVKGFITNIGGKTSHSAIIARIMEIPAVVGLSNITDLVKENDVISIDGDKGIVEINTKDLNSWTERKKQFDKEKEELKKYIDKKAVTLDGHEVDVEINIGKPTDVDNLENLHFDGVGLYRSEFLYMDAGDWPDEEKQFEAYKYVLEKNNNKIVIVRTLDIGGDKKLPYFTFDHEENPFLGVRAIRFTLHKIEIFKTQLKALLRASVFGKLGIMFPMVANIDEIKKAIDVVNECKKELKKENIPFSDDIKIGMMIEIPSSVFLSDKFSKYVDFFSVGTNDLIQYTFAADRMSQKIAYLYEPNNPALLKALEMTINGAKNNNTTVAMCGEMAGEILSIPILLGLANKGLDALSVSPSSVLKVKRLISNLKHSECIELANQALQLETASEVNKLVENFLKNKKLI